MVIPTSPQLATRSINLQRTFLLLERLAGNGFRTEQKKTADHHQAEISRNIFRRLRASHSSRLSLIRLELSPEPRGSGYLVSVPIVKNGLSLDNAPAAFRVFNSSQNSCEHSSR